METNKTQSKSFRVNIRLMLRLTVIKTISKVNLIHIISATLGNYRIFPKLSPMFPVSKFLHSERESFHCLPKCWQGESYPHLVGRVFQNRQLIYEHIQESETYLIPKVKLKSKSGLSLLLSWQACLHYPNLKRPTNSINIYFFILYFQPATNTNK